MTYKYLIILYIFLLGCCINCNHIYDNADIYIKTIDGKEYTCKRCTMSESEELHWTDDILKVHGKASSISVKKDKIDTLKIKLHHEK